MDALFCSEGGVAQRADHKDRHSEYTSSSDRQKSTIQANSLIFARQHLPITSVCTDFSLSMIGSKEMIWRTHFSVARPFWLIFRKRKTLKNENKYASIIGERTYTCH